MPQGTVTGGIRLEAGSTSAQQVKSYSWEHRAGTVLISQDGKQIKSIQVGDGHAFYGSLPPGSSSVTAKVPGFGCDPRPARITKTRTTNVEVVCSGLTPIG